jgi:RNA recognition motif-containing protein
VLNFYDLTFWRKEFQSNNLDSRITETITEADLRDHFEKFGSVTDVYVPKPFRSFAFVTFCESRYTKLSVAKLMVQVKLFYVGQNFWCRPKVMWVVTSG